MTDVDPLPGPTFWDHVTTLLPPDGRGPLPDAGEPLPDAPPPDPSKLGWSGGSMDGVSERFGNGKDDGPAARLAAATREFLSGSGSSAQVHALAGDLCDLKFPRSYDRYLDAVLADPGLSRARLHAFARWLCRHAVRRQQAKAGLALLGVVGNSDDAVTVKHLGLVEELTLYAVVALRNLLPRPDLELLDLGRQVRYWGRIQVVLRLNGSTEPEVRRWLLRDGYRNGVMVEESAYVAASTGDLLAALTTEGDDALLDHAGELLRALITGGPAQDMRDYPDGGPAIARYLDRILTAPLDLNRARHLLTVHRYLCERATDNPHLTDTELQRLAGIASKVLERAECRALVMAALNGDSLADVKGASSLARYFGVDPLPVLAGWPPRAAHDGWLWQRLAKAADSTRLADLIDEADHLLPFDELPSGPRNDHGLRPGMEAVHCLEVLIQELTRFPGIGLRAIEVGLISQVNGCRNAACRALSAWPENDRPSELMDIVRAMAWQDPADYIRTAARELVGDPVRTAGARPAG